jgi:hypothetical protein
VLSLPENGSTAGFQNTALHCFIKKLDNEWNPKKEDHVSESQTSHTFEETCSST